MCWSDPPCDVEALTLAPCSPGLALLSCSGLLQHVVKHLGLNDLHALSRTCAASREACREAMPQLRQRVEVRCLQLWHKSCAALSDLARLQALLEAGHPVLSEPAGDVLQRLNQRAAQLAVVRRGRLAPVSEAYLAASVDLDAPFGMQRSMHSPDGHHAALLAAGCFSVARLSSNRWLTTASEQLPSNEAVIGFSPSSALLGLVHLRPQPNSTAWTVVSNFFDLASGLWTAGGLHSCASASTELLGDLCFSFDSGLAACLLSPEPGKALVLIVSVLDCSVWELFPVPVDTTAQLRWVPGRHLLLVVGPDRVLTITVRPGLACGQLQLPQRCSLDTVRNLTIVTAEQDSEGGLLAVSVASPNTAQAQQIGLAVVILREPTGSLPAGTNLQTVFLEACGNGVHTADVSFAGHSSSLCSAVHHITAQPPHL